MVCTTHIDTKYHFLWPLLILWSLFTELRKPRLKEIWQFKKIDPFPQSPPETMALPVIGYSLSSSVSWFSSSRIFSCLGSSCHWVFVVLKTIRKGKKNFIIKYFLCQVLHSDRYTVATFHFSFRWVSLCCQGFSHTLWQK